MACFVEACDSLHFPSTTELKQHLKSNLLQDNSSTSRHTSGLSSRHEVAKTHLQSDLEATRCQHSYPLKLQGVKKDRMKGSR